MKALIFIRIYFIIVIIVLLNSCKKEPSLLNINPEEKENIPIILNVTPKILSEGDTISITGRYFDTLLTKNAVFIDSLQLLILGGSTEELLAKMPDSLLTGKIIVKTGKYTLSGPTITIIKDTIPKIISLLPNPVYLLDKAVVTVKNFDVTKENYKIFLGTIEMSIDTAYSSMITFTVPLTAVSGIISIVYDGNTIMGQDLLVRKRWKKTADFINIGYYFQQVVSVQENIFLAGGVNIGPMGNSSTSYMVKYNSTSEYWEGIGFLKYDRMSHGIAVLKNGNVFIAGGARTNSHYSNTFVNSFEIINPITGAKIKDGDLSIRRAAFSMMTLSNGRILMMGGISGLTDDASLNTYSIKNHEIYDPISNVFHLVDSSVVPGSLLKLFNGNIISIGQNAYSTFDESSELWNTNLFTNSPSFTPAYYVVIDSGNIFAMSGSALGRCAIFNIKTSSWIDAGNTNKQYQHIISLIRLSNGKILLVGGDYKYCELYDPRTDKWQVVESLNEEHGNQARAILTGGKVLVFGGGYGQYINPSCELYIPAP